MMLLMRIQTSKSCIIQILEVRSNYKPEHQETISDQSKDVSRFVSSFYIENIYTQHLKLILIWKSSVYEGRGGWWGLVRTQNPAGYKWSKLSELFSIVSRVKSGHVCTWSLCPSWSTCHQTSPDRRQGSMLDWWWCQVMFYRSRVKTNKYCQVS